MFTYSHSEIEEQAAETVARMKTAKSLTKDEFIKAVGRNAWKRFYYECVDSSNQITGYYKSISKGKECLYVEVGNIDRIFKEAT